MKTADSNRNRPPQWRLLPLLIFSISIFCGPAREEPAPDSSLTPPPAEMLRGFLTGIANEQLAERRAAIAEIRNPADVRRRQEYIRSTLRKLMGGLPEGRAPLNMRRTGALDRGEYRVEKVVYESLPEFYVTGSLYIPQTGSPPYPAVLQPVADSPAVGVQR